MATNYEEAWRRQNILNCQYVLREGGEKELESAWQEFNKEYGHSDGSRGDIPSFMEWLVNKAGWNL